MIVVKKVNPWMGLVFGHNLVIHHNMLKLKLVNSVKQRKHQTAALLNKPVDDNTSVDKVYNSKKQNFDAANCNVPNVPKTLHHGRTSLYDVYKTLINNDHLSIVYIA